MEKWVGSNQGRPKTCVNRGISSAEMAARNRDSAQRTNIWVGELRGRTLVHAHWSLARRHVLVRRSHLPEGTIESRHNRQELQKSKRRFHCVHPAFTAASTYSPTYGSIGLDFRTGMAIRTLAGAAGLS